MNIEKPMQVLVRRRASLGDVIMATGVVRELKKKYKCDIDIATEYPNVFDNNPHVRAIYHTDATPKVESYDLYVNLDDAYELNPVNHYLDSYFYRFFNTSEVDKFIVVHSRQWHWALKNMSWDTWYAVFEQLFTTRTDFKIITVGSAQDGSVAHPLFVDAREKLNIQQQKLLMDRATCFVGIDSGPYHIAAASDTHIVSLHTHLLPERILPHRKRVMGYNTTAIQSDVECVGCNDTQQRPVRQIVCKHGDFRCSNNFDSTRIATCVLELL